MHSANPETKAKLTLPHVVVGHAQRKCGNRIHITPSLQGPCRRGISKGIDDLRATSEAHLPFTTPPICANRFDSRSTGSAPWGCLRRRRGDDEAMVRGAMEREPRSNHGLQAMWCHMALKSRAPPAKRTCQSRAQPPLWC